MARPRDPQIDRLIVDACVELLDERGRAGLSRAQVAERAGVSLPAVNRRYADVEAILVEVARTPGSPRRAVGPAPTSLREFLVVGATALTRTAAVGGIRRAAAELLAAAAGSEAVDAAFRDTLRDLRREGLSWVEHAKRSGDLGGDVDGELLLDLVTGSIYYRLLWRNEVMDEEEVAELVDLVLAGAVLRPQHA